MKSRGRGVIKPQRYVAGFFNLALVYNVSPGLINPVFKLLAVVSFFFYCNRLFFFLMSKKKEKKDTVR